MAAQYRQPGSGEKDLHHAQSLNGVGEPDHQFLILFQRLLHGVDLAHDDGPYIVRRRSRGRGGFRVLSRREERLFGKLLGEIDERHLV